jgi:hypothetical protein
MFGDRVSHSPRSLNRHRSLIGSSCAFLPKIKCPIDRTQLRVFSQRVTPGVLLWILESGAIIEGSGKFWKNKKVPNACRGGAANCFLTGTVLAAAISRPVAVLQLPIK